MTALASRFDNAFAHARKLHEGQVRKGTDPPIPYVQHLLEVCALVLAHGADEEEAIAALLHDGPEDCGGEPVLAEIRELFGDRVAEIVEHCSDTFETPKPPWEERKRAYVAALEQAPASALLVSLADKVANLRAMLDDHRLVGDALWDRFKPAREKTLWYYREIVRVGEARAEGPARRLVERLARTLEELERESAG